MWATKARLVPLAQHAQESGMPIASMSAGFEMQATKARLLPPHGPGIQVQLPLHPQPCPSSKAPGSQIASDLPKSVGLDNYISRTAEGAEPSDTAALSTPAHAEHANLEHAHTQAAAQGIPHAGISDQSSSAGEQQSRHVIGAAVGSCCAVADPTGTGHDGNQSATETVGPTDEDRNPNVHVTAASLRSISAAEHAEALHVSAHTLPQQPAEAQSSCLQVAAKAPAPSAHQASASHEAAQALRYQPAAQPAASTAQQGSASQEPIQEPIQLVSHQPAEAQQLQPHVAAKDSPSTIQQQVTPCNPVKDLPHPPAEAQQAIAENAETEFLAHEPAVAQHPGSQTLIEASVPAAEELRASHELAEAFSNQPTEVGRSDSPMSAEASVLDVMHRQGLSLVGAPETSQPQMGTPHCGCAHS